MAANFTRIPQLFVGLLLGMFVACSTGARAADDSAALAGLKEGKIAFDIREGNPKLLLGKLNVIDETRQSLIQQGVKPHFILTFRGAPQILCRPIRKRSSLKIVKWRQESPPGSRK